MFRTLLRRAFRWPSRDSRPVRKPWQGRFVPALEVLDERVTPAVVASFVPNTGILTVTGDAANNTITLSRNAAGTIFVNGGAIAITGGTPTVANTTLFQVLGQDGNDTIRLDETNGALPAAQLF